MSTDTGPMKILWVDDDAPGRFVYEEYLVRQAGWDLIWATDVLAAANLLCNELFDALILDQMCSFFAPSMPGEHLHPKHQLWSGCFLIRWLRGAQVPESAPWLSPANQERLWGLSPLPENASVPAIIATAFHADEVERAIRGASAQDAQIDFLAKPLSEDALLDFLESVIG